MLFRGTSPILSFRSNGVIEIWDIKNVPYFEKSIPNESDINIEDIVWAGDRLFTVGLTGELIEWNLKLLNVLNKQLATGGAIWCVDINRDSTLLALGTENGYINIFDISDDQMIYKNLFDKQEGRILVCKFDKTGDFVVTGSMDAIRIWDTKTGHALHKMSIPRVESKKSVIVWTLQVLSDFTIICGDSRGVITVWCGKTASLLESHQVLKADILALAINEEENLLICSGVEPIIRILAKTQIKREDVILNKWVKYLQRTVHDFDIKALLCFKDKIISGGIDGYVGVSSVGKAHSCISKYAPFLHSQCVTVAADERLLLLRYLNYLEVWRFGTSYRKLDEMNEDDTTNECLKQNCKLELTSGPEKLIEMRSKNDDVIVCSTISPNGKWLIYSTQTDIRLFSLNVSKEKGIKSQLRRIKYLPDQFSAATKVFFTSDSSRLFVAKSNRTIDIFSICPNSEIDLKQTIDTTKFIKDTIHLMDISNCGTYFVVAGTCRTISVWIKNKSESELYSHHIKLPRYLASTTAIALHQNIPRVVVAFSDGKIFEYDLEEMCFTCTDKDFFNSHSGTHCIKGILLDSKNPNIYILYNEQKIFVVQKISKEDSISNSKKSKCNETEVPGLTIASQKAYEVCIFFIC